MTTYRVLRVTIQSREALETIYYLETKETIDLKETLVMTRSLEGMAWTQSMETEI